MQNEVPSLEGVKSHFDHWRTTRPKRCKTPSFLWDKVRPLILVSPSASEPLSPSRFDFLFLRPEPKINSRKLDNVILCSANALGSQTAKRMQDMAKERVSAGKSQASIAAMALLISSDDLSTTAGSSSA